MRRLRSTGLALFLGSLVMTAGCCYKVQNFGYTREVRIGKVGCQAPFEICNSCTTPAPAPAHEPPQAMAPKPPQPGYTNSARPTAEYRLPNRVANPDAGGAPQGSTAKPVQLMQSNPPRQMPDIRNPATRIVAPDSADLTLGTTARPRVTQPTPVPPPEYGVPAAGDAAPDTAQMQGPVSRPPIRDVP
jgi:hypothetical protein